MKSPLKALSRTGVSRRSLLKLGAAAGLSCLAWNAVPTVSGVSNRKNLNGRIVIVGGGLAGCSIANYLTRRLTKPDITIIEPDETSVSYQPGQTLVGTGIWELHEIIARSDHYFPKEARWVKDAVVEFDPEKNEVVTASNRTIPYDFLVVTTGLKLDYDKIEGMSRDLIGKHGIASIYTREGAAKTWDVLLRYIDRATNKDITGLFTHPNTPVKCSGASKKIVFLAVDRLKEAGVRKNANLIYYTGKHNMFSVPEFDKILVEKFREEDVGYRFNCNLVGINPQRKEAIFTITYTVQGEYDEDLDEYTKITRHEGLTVPYDFIHITPPMSAPDPVQASDLAWQKGSAAQGGWIEVERETLQHRRYPNVFSFGDVAGIPFAKTGGSVRRQYKIVARNLLSVMEGKEPTEIYGGYTVCPLITGIGKVILAEFDYSGDPAPSFPLDPTEERWIWWLLKLHLLKPLWFQGILKGYV